MSIKIKENIQPILTFLFFIWLLSIARQIAAPSGVIGVTLDTDRKKNVYISKIEPNKPAHQTGLQKKDYIITVDGKSVEGKNKHYVSSKITGKPNTEVKLLIKRETSGNPALIEYKINRTQRKINWFIFF